MSGLGLGLGLGCEPCAQVLVLPVFKPRRWVPLTKDPDDDGDDDDDGGDGGGDDEDMVAILQLVRPHGAPPLTDDDAYLCELLAPHLAHALAGAQAVEPTLTLTLTLTLTRIRTRTRL